MGIPNSRSVQRLIEAGLAVSKGRGDWDVVPEALAEFAVHGVRYAFPAKMGALRRGIPTSFGASPLSAQISAAPGEAPVWPHAEGQAWSRKVGTEYFKPTSGGRQRVSGTTRRAQVVGLQSTAEFQPNTCRLGIDTIRSQR